MIALFITASLVLLLIKANDLRTWLIWLSHSPSLGFFEKPYFRSFVRTWFSKFFQKGILPVAVFFHMIKKVSTRLNRLCITQKFKIFTEIESHEFCEFCFLVIFVATNVDEINQGLQNFLNSFNSLKVIDSF